MSKGEKILIFTKARDTLLYLERRLLERVSKVAKIVGGFSMELRREQVELFRNLCPIMLKLIGIEERREQRIAEIERERNIQMRPTRKTLQITLRPDGKPSARSIHSDWVSSIQRYEMHSGRTNISEFDEFGLVDFYSETSEGEPRLIITTDDPDYKLSPEHRQDLGDWMDKTYLYCIKNGEVEEVDKL